MKKRDFFTATATLLAPMVLSEAEAQEVEQRHTQTTDGDEKKSASLFAEIRGARSVGWSMWESWRLDAFPTLVSYKFTVSIGTAKRFGVAIITDHNGGYVLVVIRQLISANGTMTTINIIEALPVPLWLIDIVKNIVSGVDGLDPKVKKIGGVGFTETVVEISKLDTHGVKLFEITYGGIPKEINWLCRNIIDLCHKLNLN